MYWSPITYVVSMLSNPIEFALTPRSQTFTLPVSLIQGFLAALVYHVLITVVLGSDIASAILCWALSNAVYALSVESTDILTSLKAIFLFNAIYVILYSPRAYQ